MQKQYVELNKNLKLEKDKIENIEKLENKLNKISEKEKAARAGTNKEEEKKYLKTPCTETPYLV